MLTSLYCRNTAQELNELEKPDKMLLPTGIFCVGVALLLCFAKHFFTDYFAIFPYFIRTIVHGVVCLVHQGAFCFAIIVFNRNTLIDYLHLDVLHYDLNC